MAAMLVTKKLNLSSEPGLTLPPAPAVPLPAAPPLLLPPAPLAPLAPLVPLAPPAALPLAPAVDVEPLMPEVVPAWALLPPLAEPAWPCAPPPVPAWVLLPAVGVGEIGVSVEEQAKKPRLAQPTSKRSEVFRSSRIFEARITHHCDACARLATIRIRWPSLLLGGRRRVEKAAQELTRLGVVEPIRAFDRLASWDTARRGQDGN